MKIVGEATITKYLIKEDGSLEKNFETTQKNIITKNTIADILDGPTFTDSLKIAFSINVASESFENTSLTQINAVGDPTLVAPNDYVFTDRTGGNPAQLVYTNRFNPPASNRTINKIGMVSGATLVDDAGATTSRTCYTELLLGTPVTQLTIEIIDVAYKLFIDWTATRLRSPFMYQRNVEWKFFAQTGSGTGSFGYTDAHTCIPWIETPYTTYLDETYTNITRPHVGGYASLTSADGVNSPISWSFDPFPFASNNYADHETEYGRLVYGFGQTSGETFLSDHFVGQPVRGIQFGHDIDTLDAGFDANGNSTAFPLPDYDDNELTDGQNNWAGFAPFPKSSNISNVFSHSATAPLPMYDVGNLANSSWKPTVTELVNNPEFPANYYLKVDLAGGLGVGRYKLYKAGFGGWTGNTFDFPIHPPLFMIGGMGAQQDPTNELMFYNAYRIYNWSTAIGDYQFVTYKTHAGIALTQITDRAYTETDRFPLSVYTQFGTVINDIAVDPVNDKIYVACETGLYEIVVTGAVVTQLHPDACATVEVANAGQVFALFRDGAGSGRLSSSIAANWGVALDLTGATINWDNVWRIFIDPDSLNYNLMFYEGTTPKLNPLHETASYPKVAAIKIHWWNNVSNWIQTDSYDFTIVSPYVSGINAYEDENLVLVTNDCVKITNGVWIYPTNRTNSGGALVKTNNQNEDITLTRMDPATPMPYDFKYGAATVTNSYWNNTVASSAFNRGWNFINTGSKSNHSFSTIMGVEGDYAFGFHATTPFHTEELEGTICGLVVGKPNAVATTYDLAFTLGCKFQSSRTAETTGNQYRCPIMLKLQVDEGGTSTLVDYALNDPLYRIVRRNTTQAKHLMFSNHKVIHDKMILWFSPIAPSGIEYDDTTADEPVGRFSGTLPQFPWDAAIGVLSPVYIPEDDLADRWLQAYEWTGAAWIVDEDNTGPGKPLHTTTDVLVDGLQISWTDLNPGSSQDFVLDQFYNFVRITEPSTFLVETTVPNVSGNWEILYRDMVANSDAGTTPAGAPLRIYLPEAPLGTAPDAEWLTAPNYNLGEGWTATINSVEVPIIIDPSTTPAAGTIHLTDPAAGELYINAIDSSQPYTIGYEYLRKYDTTEVL